MHESEGDGRLREGAGVLPFDRTTRVGERDGGPGDLRRAKDGGGHDHEPGFDDGWEDGFGFGDQREFYDESGMGGGLPASHRFGGGRGYGRAPRRGYGADLGQLTLLVLLDDQVVDTVRRPVEGSGYECAALELGRGAPRPALKVVEVPAQPRHELERTWLRSLVGGADQLDALTKDPLPDEPLDVALVPADLRDRVTAIAERVDAVALALIGLEGRTACRRLLVRAVAAEPALLRGNERDDIAAGAVVHAIAKANNVIGPGCALTSTALWTQMGLKSSPHDRARRFAHAVAGPDGVDVGSGYYHRREPDVWRLGSADLLVGRFRGFLMVMRAIADIEGVGSAAG